MIFDSADHYFIAKEAMHLLTYLHICLLNNKNSVMQKFNNQHTVEK